MRNLVLALCVLVLVLVVVLIVWFPRNQNGPTLTSINEQFTEMPARSLIMMKNHRLYLATKVADDRPYLLDVLESPGGEWKRVEFDAVMRLEVLGVSWSGMIYETQAALFLKQ